MKFHDRDEEHGGMIDSSFTAVMLWGTKSHMEC